MWSLAVKIYIIRTAEDLLPLQTEDKFFDFFYFQHWIKRAWKAIKLEKSYFPDCYLQQPTN